MKRLWTFGLCLVAVAAISIDAVATASAELPEYVPAQSGQKIKGSSGASKLETPGLPPIECASSKSAGKLKGTKETTALKVTFKKCSAEGGAKVCNTKPEKPGLIKTNKIKATIGYLNKATKNVGVKFVPEKAGTLFAKFTCGEGAGLVTIEVQGATYGEQTPVNVSSKTGEVALRNGGSGPSGQQFENFEGETAHHLESFFNGAGPFASNQQQVAKETTETALEIKA
jgi:hypothetical protein